MPSHPGKMPQLNPIPKFRFHRIYMSVDNARTSLRLGRHVPFLRDEKLDSQVPMLSQRIDQGLIVALCVEKILNEPGARCTHNTNSPFRVGHNASVIILVMTVRKECFYSHPLKLIKLLKWSDSYHKRQNSHDQPANYPAYEGYQLYVVITHCIVP